MTISTVQHRLSFLHPEPLPRYDPAPQSEEAAGAPRREEHHDPQGNLADQLHDFLDPNPGTQLRIVRAKPMHSRP